VPIPVLILAQLVGIESTKIEDVDGVIFLHIQTPLTDWDLGCS
jgi:hypothetical protein